MTLLMGHLAKLASTLDALNEWLGRVVSWVSLGMVVTTFIVVLLRYVFDLGWIWLQESVTFMHATLFLLGAAYTMKHQGHVRVDIFYNNFTPRQRDWIDLLGTLLLLLPVCIFILFISWDYVAQSWQLHEGSREAGGLNGVYLLKTLIPLMALLMILQGLAEASRCLLRLTGSGEMQSGDNA